MKEFTQKFKKNQRVIVHDKTKDWDGEYVTIVGVSKTGDKKDFIYTVKTSNGKKWDYYGDELSEAFKMKESNSGILVFSDYETAESARKILDKHMDVSFKSGKKDTLVIEDKQMAKVILQRAGMKGLDKQSFSQEEVNTTNADGAVQPTQAPEEKDFKDEGLDTCPNCGNGRFLKLKSGQLQCEKCKRVLVQESFSENNSEGNNMSEEEKTNPPAEEQPPVEGQTPVEESKTEPEKPEEEKSEESGDEAPKDKEEKLAEKIKLLVSEALKEQDDSSEEETEEIPETTDEEPMEEMADMDKVADILQKIVADINAIKQKIGLSEESADEEEVIEESEDGKDAIEESEDGEQEEDKMVEEPSATESFNPGKIVFGETHKNEESFKEMVRNTMKK